MENLRLPSPSWECTDESLRAVDFEEQQKAETTAQESGEVDSSTAAC